MTAARFAPQIFGAMADQLDRVNNTPERLQERIEDLQAQVDRLIAQVKRQQRTIESYQGGRDSGPAEVHEASGTLLNSRPVGNQSEFARQHHVPAYQVSRWCANGDIQFIRRGGKYFVYLDQPAPASKKRGRKSS